MIRWKKRGVVFVADGNAPWMKTHTQIPTLLEFPGFLRIYYSTRNEKNQSLVGAIDVDKNNPLKILEVHTQPVINLGLPGEFDEIGVMPSAVVKLNGKIRMFYTAWSKGNYGPYNLSIGLAESDDGLHFNKIGNVIKADTNEHYLCASPCVIHDGEKFHMWYSSGTSWKKVFNKLEPVYIARYASSVDGINWHKSSVECFEPLNDEEAIARPWVMQHAGKFHMWYSYRDSRDFRGGKGSYLMGYAESDNLVTWKRDDEKSGLGLSEIGYDSEMLAYPCTIKLGGKIYMFYNGNGFGRTGICLAEAI